MQENRNSFQVSGIKVFNSATKAAKNKTSVKMSREAFAHIDEISQVFFVVTGKNKVQLLRRLCTKHLII